MWLKRMGCGDSDAKRRELERMRRWDSHHLEEQCQPDGVEFHQQWDIIGGNQEHGPTTSDDWQRLNRKATRRPT
jgi:hypothetical protein